MNIAIFTDTYLPDINGVVTSTVTLCKELKKHDHHVLIVTTDLPNDTNYKDDEHIIRLPAIDIKKLYGYRVSGLYSFNGMKDIKEFKPDIIHIQTEFGVGIFGKIVGELLNVPVCYTYHTMWADYSHYLSKDIKPIDFVMKKIIEKISKIYGNTCAQMIVPSQKTANTLMKYGINRNMNVIPTGIEISKFQNIDIDELHKLKHSYQLNNETVLLYVGRIAKEKSIDIIIDTITILQNRIPIKLLIIGEGPEKEELISYTKRKECENNVLFLGSKPSELIPYYYHLGDIFISASLTETQGLTYIEAMASGLIVCGRKDDNLRDVIIEGYNGYFFKDADDLANIILSIKNISDMKKNALEYSKEFSSELFYKRIIDVYKKAIDHDENLYLIQSIDKIDNQMVGVFVKDKHQITINLTKEIIESYQLEVNQYVDRETIDNLLELEEIKTIYNQALKYLSYKDYSYIGLKKRLEKKNLYTDLQIDMTLQLLQDKGLIDDYDYCDNYIRRYLKRGYGFNKIIYNLKEEGISPTVIDKSLLNYSSDLEYEQAYKIATKLYENNTNKSPNALMSYIQNKLFNKGFTNESVQKTISEFDFTYPEERLYLLLKKEYERVLKRYQNKYEGKDLQQRIIRFLVQKGYQYSDIIDMLEMEEDNND